VIRFKDFIKEDGAPAPPANAASGGGIAGIGIGPNGEPGVAKKRKKKLVLGTIRRKTPPK
jgi:hypothetical protein